MPNIASIIKSHNAKITKPAEENQHKRCNCGIRGIPANCPLNGNCLATNLVYKATVTADNKPSKVYIGMTEHAFKSRYNNHITSLKHQSHRNDTALSKYIKDCLDTSTTVLVLHLALKTN